LTVYIGSDHALDPERYFIVCVNQIGSGLSTSPHNSDGELAMSKFPSVRIGDDVVAQERLLSEHFGIETFELVVEWAVRFPDKVRRAAPIAGTAQNTPHDFLYARRSEKPSSPTRAGTGATTGSTPTSVMASSGTVVGFSTEFRR